MHVGEPPRVGQRVEKRERLVEQAGSAVESTELGRPPPPTRGADGTSRRGHPRARTRRLPLRRSPRAPRADRSVSGPRGLPPGRHRRRAAIAPARARALRARSRPRRRRCQRAARATRGSERRLGQMPSRAGGRSEPDWVWWRLGSPVRGEPTRMPGRFSAALGAVSRKSPLAPTRHLLEQVCASRRRLDARRTGGSAVAPWPPKAPFLEPKRVACVLVAGSNALSRAHLQRSHFEVQLAPRA